MPTVYLAHDVKHDRKVALKVLKPELALRPGDGGSSTAAMTSPAMTHGLS
jgi:serine/threonine protein kinase